MQTVYYTTHNFISHRNNVVELDTYRKKLALAQEGNLVPLPWGADGLDAQRGEKGGEAVLLRDRPRRSRQLPRQATLLDVCASLSVVVMTLTMTLRILLS